MDLSNLLKLKGKQRKAKRVGRGVGSGKGSHTSGKGHKGQKARTGFNLPIGFEGGQVPLYKKMPKKSGFFSSHKVTKITVNVGSLNDFKDSEKITAKELLKEKIISGTASPVKILGSGELTKKLFLSGFTYSESAKKKIEALGGKAD